MKCRVWRSARGSLRTLQMTAIFAVESYGSVTSHSRMNPAMPRPMSFALRSWIGGAGGLLR
jgi:hypothetical protein